MRLPKELHDVDYTNWTVEELLAAQEYGDQQSPIFAEDDGNDDHFTAIECDMAEEELEERREIFGMTDEERNTRLRQMRETVRANMIAAGLLKEKD